MSDKNYFAYDHPLFEEKSKQITDEFQQYLQSVSQIRLTTISKTSEIEFKKLLSGLQNSNLKKRKSLLTSSETRVNTLQSSIVAKGVDPLGRGLFTSQAKFRKLNYQHSNSINKKSKPRMLSSGDLSSYWQNNTMQQSTTTTTLVQGVEEDIFRHNMTKESLNAMYEEERNSYVRLKLDIEKLKKENETESRHISKLVQMRNLAASQQIYSAQLLERGHKQMQRVLKKAIEQKDRHIQRSKVIHKSQELAKAEYVRQQIRKDQLLMKSTSSLHQLKKLNKSTSNFERKENIKSIITAMDKMLQLAKQSEPDFQTLIKKYQSKTIIQRQQSHKRQRSGGVESLNTEKSLTRRSIAPSNQLSTSQLISDFEQKYKMPIQCVGQLASELIREIKSRHSLLVVEHEEAIQNITQLEKEFEALSKKCQRVRDEIMSEMDSECCDTFKILSTSEKESDTFSQNLQKKTEIMVGLIQFAVHILKRYAQVFLNNPEYPWRIYRVKSMKPLSASNLVFKIQNFIKRYDYKKVGECPPFRRTESSDTFQECRYYSVCLDFKGLEEYLLSLEIPAEAAKYLTTVLASDKRLIYPVKKENLLSFKRDVDFPDKNSPESIKTIIQNFANLLNDKEKELYNDLKELTDLIATCYMTVKRQFKLHNHQNSNPTNKSYQRAKFQRKSTFGRNAQTALIYKKKKFYSVFISNDNDDEQSIESTEGEISHHLPQPEKISTVSEAASVEVRKKTKKELMREEEITIKNLLRICKSR